MSKEPDYFDKKVDEYSEILIGSANNAFLFECTLKLLIKEVSRDTRHKAAEISQEPHSNIFNLKMD